MKSSRLIIFMRFLIVGLAAGLCLVAVTSTAHAAPLQQSTQPVAIAMYDQVNIRTGPSTTYPVSGVLLYGESCPVVGRDTATGWWMLRCPGGTQGWVSYEVVNVVGDTSGVPLYSVGGSAIVAPPEQQAPQQPQTFSGWKASYYANKDLQGVPVLVQDVPEINFNWGYGSPGPNVPADFFSARYERTLNLASGNYLLTLRMDDGARVFIDDQPVMDDWRTGGLREMTQVRTLGGQHRFRVEYFEDSGQAVIYFSVAPFNDVPAPPPGPPAPAPVPDLAIPQDQWRAQYFNNTDLAGSPAAASYVSRGAYPLDKNWGSGSPAAGVGADYWSARFEGNFYFTPADYDFFAQSDDGVRVYIDNILIIDAWYDGYKQASNKFDRIGDGYHLMRVDYYERAGDAYVRVWWGYRGSSSPVQPSGNTSNDIPPPPPPPGPP